MSEELFIYQQPPTLPTVHLRGAPLPIITRFALHLYFVVSSGNLQWDRWEVWQFKGVLKPTNSRQKYWGHVYLNLMPPLQGVGGGDSFFIRSWQGKEAEKILAALHDNAENYIYRNHYLIWPGPNSNTYVRIILDRAGFPVSLPGTAVGKDWDGLLSIKYSSRPFNLSLHTPLIGLNLSFTDNLELIFLGWTILGINFKFKEIKYPFSRGFIKVKTPK